MRSPILISSILLLLLSSCSQDVPKGAEQTLPSVIQAIGTNGKLQEDDLHFRQARQEMVAQQLKARDITNKEVLEVMGTLPRQDFIPSDVRHRAYNDNPLPIGHGQTISQPYIVALMTQELELSGNEKVLEIGTGSGYQAAVLAEIVEEVYTIEIIEALAKRANATLQQKYDTVHVMHGDGYFGWKEQAPFDRIIVTAASNHIPPPLLEQLQPGGKLIIPLGDISRFQTLTAITKQEEGELDTRFITGVRFVPLTGRALEE